jgi:hypothetical protein
MKFSNAVSVLVGLAALSQGVTVEETCDSISKYSTEVCPNISEASVKMVS